MWANFIPFDNFISGTSIWKQRCNFLQCENILFQSKYSYIAEYYINEGAAVGRYKIGSLCDSNDPRADCCRLMT